MKKILSILLKILHKTNLPPSRKINDSLKGINVEEEYELIKQKKSKLSRGQRNLIKHKYKMRN
jgi:hypothetical protein